MYCAPNVNAPCSLFIIFRCKIIIYGTPQLNICYNGLILICMYFDYMTMFGPIRMIWLWYIWAQRKKRSEMTSHAPLKWIFISFINVRESGVDEKCVCPQQLNCLFNMIPIDSSIIFLFFVNSCIQIYVDDDDDDDETNEYILD